jgi:hypothetical protein
MLPHIHNMISRNITENSNYKTHPHHTKFIKSSRDDHAHELMSGYSNTRILRKHTALSPGPSGYHTVRGPSAALLGSGDNIVATSCALPYRYLYVSSIMHYRYVSSR